jgi:type IV secretion system protein TrbL
MRIIFTLLLTTLLAINPAFATGAPDTGAMNALLHTFEHTAGQWPAIIMPVTTWVFWTLVTLSWAWGFGEMALKGADVKDLLAELVKRTFLVGFFWWLLVSAPTLGAAIVNGFGWIGTKLAGGNTTVSAISPSSIFDIGISLVTQILKKLSMTSAVDSLGYILVAIGIIIIFAFITLQLMVVIIQYYFFLNAGVVMMGFLGHEWSREYGINYFKLMIGIGVKYLTMQLIIVLCLGIVEGWLKQSDLTWTQLIIILPTMIVIWGLIREVPQMAQSLVSGNDQTTGNAMAGAMQAAATAAALAAGGYAAAGGLGGMTGKAMQGAGDMSQLLQGAWNEASSGGDGSGASMDNADPATSTPPNSDINASSEDSPSAQAPQETHTSNAQETPQAQSPPKGFAATAAVAAGIAGRAIGNEIKGSAKNAFTAGMAKFTAPLTMPSNSSLGKAAQSLNPTLSTSNQGSSSPWMQQSDGLQNLSPQDQQQARKNYGEWIENPEHTFSLNEYVSYTQGKNNQE